MNFKKLLIASAAILMMGTSAFADVVNANDSNVYNKFVYPGQVTITLEGYCSYGQDIDLWVYDDADKGYKSTTYGCYEQIDLNIWEPTNLRIVVENKNHPFDTAYDLYVNNY